MRARRGILACCSTALSAAALLGAAFLSALTDPTLSRPALEIASAIRPFFASLRPTLGEANGEITEQVRWSNYEVALSVMECLRLLAPLNADVVPVGPLHDGDCGSPAPVFLRSLGAKEKVTFDPPLLLNCPMVVALHRWLESTVQPAAKEALSSPVVQIVGSSYSCRTAYSRPDTRLSQHAFANAIDLPVLVLANRQKIDIATGWGATARDLATTTMSKLATVTSQGAGANSIPKGAKIVRPANKPSALTVTVKASTLDETSSSGQAKPIRPAPPAASLSAPQSTFLRRIHRGACGTFSTVLGPEANEEHRNHLHLDLQERNSLDVCK